MRRILGTVMCFSLLALLILGSSAIADSSTVDFESYAAGNINGQNGWTGSGIPINTSIDEGIVTNGGGVPASFGTQSWRFSNAYENGSFGDWPFSPSLTDEAGETSAEGGAFSGGARQTHFEAEWDFTSADPSGEQVGLAMSMAPDRGDGARMSYIRLEDQAAGLAVYFDDYQDVAPFGGSVGDVNGCTGSDDFVETLVASGLSRSAAHTVKLAIDFVDGPRNDVARVWVNGSLVHTGTSWEDYFRYCEGNATRTVDSMIFQARGSTPAVGTLGYGFLLDNISYSSSGDCTTVCYVDDVDGNDAFSGVDAANAKKTIQAGIDAVDPGGEVRVLPATYAESPNIAKSLTLVSTAGRATTFIELQTGPTYLGALTIGGDDVTVDGFTIVGRDGTPTTIAASNIVVKDKLNEIVIKNSRLRVGNTDPGSTNGDDGFGILTYWNTTPAEATASLSVNDNIFEPLTAIGRRAFYVNPGVDSFTFQANEISGNFAATSITQAGDGLVKDNTVTGSGSSAGLGTWSHPDPDLYGKTHFVGNEISAVTSAITINETNNVTVDHNVISGATSAVRVLDLGSFSGALDPTSVSINRNSLAVGGANNGIIADAGFAASVDGTCNWWGSFSGPGAVASGSGSLVTTNVDYAPWLASSNLDADCSPNGSITIILQTHPENSTVFPFTVTNGIAPFSLFDDGGVANNTKTFNVPAGTYVFQAGALPRWALISLTCDSQQSILRSHRRVQIQLHSDENVTCTFTESYRVPDAMIATTSGGPWTGDDIYATVALPTQTLTQSFTAGQTQSFYVLFENDGLDTDRYRVASKLKGSLKYGVVFMYGNIEITGKVNAGTYRFKLAPGATRVIEIRVTAGAITGTDARKIILTMQSRTAPAALDTVRAIVNSGP